MEEKRRKIKVGVGNEFGQVGKRPFCSPSSLKPRGEPWLSGAGRSKDRTAF